VHTVALCSACSSSFTGILLLFAVLVLTCWRC
jgi:hypothetical protein